MSVRYSIDKSQGLIVSVGEGAVRFDDVRDHQNRLLADPDFDPTFDQLVDGTRVTRIDASTHELRILASRPVFSRDSRRALVFTQPHVFGVGRVMAVFHGDLSQVHVFYSMEQALTWLGKSIPVG
jgi:hypothetical protein